jgi:hypothetical protein
MYRTNRDPAKFNCALGKIIGVLSNFFDDVIEQFVQSDKIRSLDIPMCLLRLEVQIKSISKILIQHGN